MIKMVNMAIKLKLPYMLACNQIYKLLLQKNVTITIAA